MQITIPFLLIASAAATLPAADLTGNWLIAQDMHDGTFRRTYFNLRQEGSRITGTIRVTQFFYKIAESTGIVSLCFASSANCFAVSGHDAK